MAPKKRKEAETIKTLPALVPALPASPRRTRSSGVKTPNASAALVAVASDLPEKAPAKKPKRAKDTVKEVPFANEIGAPVEGSKTIIVEACKQCNSFKVRALKVKEGLEKGVPGIIVKYNPEKPRRGCFEIREENGETFVSLMSMPRPFSKMKELDMDQVISDIIEKIK